MRIGFLFNHDATHQLPHTIMVAAALAKAGADVEILTSSAEQHVLAREMMPIGSNVRFTQLRFGQLGRTIDHVLHAVAPYRRIAILKENLNVFAALEALVVPETTSTFLKTRFGLSSLKLIYLPHGAGDGAAGFQKITRHFDLVLLSGEKVRDRMLAKGLIRRDGYAVIGYPKYDFVDARPCARLFDNAKPTVIYNPHFNPLLSSWYTIGEQVLDWFASQRNYNLVFAPHIMLFKRRIHTSIINRKMRIRSALPTRFRGLSNIIVDTGSSNLIDMSYTRSADIYLGDVSSQIYEWIRWPRPAIFFDTRKTDWKKDPHYEQWFLGDVIHDVSMLPRALESATKHLEVYAPLQRAAWANTFSFSDKPAALRAAEAILEYMARHGSESRIYGGGHSLAQEIRVANGKWDGDIFRGGAEG